MTDGPWQFRLPFPPSVNNLFRDLSPEERARIANGMARKGKTGRAPTRVVSQEYKAWRGLAEAIVAEHQMNGVLPRRGLQIPVVITIALRPADGRHRDCSNYVKAIEDVLVSSRLLQGDDERYVRGIASYWEAPAQQPHALVTLRQANDLPLFRELQAAV